MRPRFSRTGTVQRGRCDLQRLHVRTRLDAFWTPFALVARNSKIGASRTCNQDAGRDRRDPHVVPRAPLRSRCRARTMTMLRAPISPSSDSEAWLNALASSGPVHHQAVASLYVLLLGGARCEIAWRRASVGYVRGEDCDDIAMQAADDALVAVLAKLDEFRGESRFTTWAYKFALLEAGVRVRRRSTPGVSPARA